MLRPAEGIVFPFRALTLPAMPAQKLWSGRFEKPTRPEVESFTASVHYDHRLSEEDVRGSLAHARMLKGVGLLAASDLKAIEKGLEGIRQDLLAGRIPLGSSLEDIHTHIEAELTKRVGEPGKRLHTGRSRNDQVATDLRLWVRDAGAEIVSRIDALQRALLAHARSARRLVLPGYTHLQRAQPIAAAPHFLCHVERLERDRGRVLCALERANECPLGAGALAGSTLPLDRRRTARLLGFARPVANSIDAVSARDFAAEFLFALSMLSIHLSQWAEEMVLWATEEFGFLDLPEEVCTGSSLMPQKKNPDTLELIRGKSARVLGNLVRMLALLKGLPSGYNRDLQEDKEALFDAYDTTAACLEQARIVVGGIRFRVDRIRQVLDAGFLDATALAEHLVTKGVPFRDAHGWVGRWVRSCIARRKMLKDLSLEVFREASPRIDRSVYKVLGAENVVAAYKTEGSAGFREAAAAIRRWEKNLCKRSRNHRACRP